MKNLYALLLVSLLLPNVPCSAQGENLLRNGSFENISFVECESGNTPGTLYANFGLSLTLQWYGNGLLYLDRCSENYRLSHLTYEWGFSNPPNGKNLVRIDNSSWGSGNFNTNFAATELQTPLKTNHYYLFEGLVNNKGFFHFRDTMIYDCVDEPFRHYKLMVSEERIEMEQYDGDQSGHISGREVARNDSLYITQGRLSNWRLVRHCFQAKEGEKHLAISGPTGKYELQGDCKGKFSQKKFFHGFVYEFDDLKLYEVPASGQAQQIICADEPTPVYLNRLFTHPVFQGASFEWEDGIVDSIRLLQDGGIYLIQANIGCISIPLELAITTEECAAKLYVPNAFSPNNDGINDLLLPHLFTFFETTNHTFSIFDRWGNQVYQTQDLNKGWDGKMQEQPSNIDTYIWVLTYTLLREEMDIPMVKSGEVVLVR